MGRKIKTAYLCSGLDPKCSDRPGCFRFMKSGMDCCRHTFRAKYAANGAVYNPALYPERFHKTELDADTEVWWEGDVETFQD